MKRIHELLILQVSDKLEGMEYTIAFEGVSLSKSCSYFNLSHILIGSNEWECKSKHNQTVSCEKDCL